MFFHTHGAECFGVDPSVEGGAGIDRLVLALLEDAVGKTDSGWGQFGDGCFDRQDVLIAGDSDVPAAEFHKRRLTPCAPIPNT